MSGSVYAIREKGSAEFRYVGCTSGPVWVRLQAHLWPSAHKCNKPMRDWLDSLNRRDVVAVVLEETLSSEFQAEGQWIARLRGEGHRLLNYQRQNPDDFAKIEAALGEMEAEKARG